MTFDDKVVLVTGAGRGIGRAIALAFAARGAAVGVAARSEDEINAVAAEIAATGGRARALPCDVASRDSVVAAVATLKNAFGPVDILVNNAGLARFAPILETRQEDWEVMFAVNTRALLFAAQAVLPQMIERRAGVIITVASAAGHKPYPRQAGYVASKHAAVGFSKVLALETQAYGIRVHVVNPGGVDTKLVREQRDDVDFSQYMKPEEVANAVLFLAGLDGIGTVDELTLRRAPTTPWG